MNEAEQVAARLDRVECTKATEVLTAQSIAAEIRHFLPETQRLLGDCLIRNIMLDLDRVHPPAT